MRPAALLSIGALLIRAAASSARAPTLAIVRGRERVLILFAPAVGDARLAAQEKLLAPEVEGLTERDLRVARVIGDRAAGLGDGGAALRERFGIAVGAFAVRLIGKDGRVALARATPITADALFGAIDAMPMRRDELRRR